MRAILPIILLLGPAIHAEPEPAPRKTPAVSLLPNGSQLHRVILPRYDEDFRLSAVLKADVMTLVTDEVIAGEIVTIAFYNPDRSRGGRVEMNNATLNQASGLLDTREPVMLDSGRIRADGTGLIYHHDKGKGFLTGPAATRIRALTETTMTTPHPFQRPAVAVVGAALLSIATAGPPAALTEEEIATIAADAEPVAPLHQEAARAARADLRAELDTAARATADAADFLEEAGLIDQGDGAPEPTPAVPLEVDPGPEDTLITCEGGVYFDADAGLLVYLKNVVVKDPLFDLRGANELKIFLAKKPEAPADKKDAKVADKAAPAAGLGAGLGAGFGDVERVVATGAVRILQKQPEPGKEPVEAAGAIFTYYPKTGEIIITGGYPWVKQGASFFRATKPNLNLRIWKNGSFKTEGDWEMGGRLNPDR